MSNRDLFEKWFNDQFPGMPVSLLDPRIRHGKFEGYKVPETNSMWVGFTAGMKVTL